MIPKSLTAVLTGTAGAAVAALVAAGPAAASPVSAHHLSSDDRAGAVFVQNDALDGNQIVAYRRAADGGLTRLAQYDTGGLGGRLAGAAVDFTASQGALGYLPRHRELLAVNPGSDTLTVFGVEGTTLARRQIVDTAGSFPVSVTADGNRVFVLNARGGGSIQGYAVRGGRLEPVAAWHRELGLPVTTGAAEFTHTPGQIGFTPDGRHLVVTTKAATNSVLVWSIDPAGRLGDQPVVDTEAGAVPFSFAFDRAGQLQLTEAGTNSVATFRVGSDGRLTAVGTTATGQRATCWISADGDLLAASNAGSADVTTLTAQHRAAATKLADTATGPGTVDAHFSADGRFLYVQTGGNGGISSFAVDAGGALTPLGTTIVPDGAGGEGIIAF